MQFFVAGCMRAAAGTNEAQQADSGNGGGDCHGRNHSHSHGHHGGGRGVGKDKPRTPAAASNPWVISAEAAPRPQLVSGLTAATGVVILLTGAAVYFLVACNLLV